MDLGFGVAVGLAAFGAMFFVATPGSVNVIALAVLAVLSFIGYANLPHFKKRAAAGSGRKRMIVLAFLAYGAGCMLSVIFAAWYIGYGIVRSAGFFLL